jgi:hypothetical protein
MVGTQHALVAAKNSHTHLDGELGSRPLAFQGAQRLCIHPLPCLDARVLFWLFHLPCHLFPCSRPGFAACCLSGLPIWRLTRGIILCTDATRAYMRRGAAEGVAGELQGRAGGLPCQPWRPWGPALPCTHAPGTLISCTGKQQSLVTLIPLLKAASMPHALYSIYLPNASFGLLLTTLHARIARARPCQGQRPVIFLHRTQVVSPFFEPFIYNISG